MGEQAEVEVILSAGGQFYAVTGAGRERGLWLGVDKHPLPVPLEWHRPGLVCLRDARPQLLPDRRVRAAA